MSVITRISTVRHGRTDYGVEHRYAGTIDVGLSDQGSEETREAAAGLDSGRWDLVISSPQKRALETARLLVGDSGLPHVVVEQVRERNYGVMEGLTPLEVEDLHPPVLFVQVGDETHSVNPQGGESLEEVWDRARRVRKLVFSAHRGLSLLIVSHGTFLQMFHGVLRRSNLIESLLRYPANLELTTFEFEDDRLVSEESRLLGQAADRGF